MKNLILILCLLIAGVVADAQPGYTTINSRYNWLAGVFRALGMPAGDSAQFQPGQAVREGAIYWDSTETSNPKGLYIYTNGIWQLQGTGSGGIEQPDGLLLGGEVIYTGTGMVFNVRPAIYRIGGQIYTSDSTTVTLDNGGSDPRKDVFYLDTTGPQVLEGTEAESPLKPQVEAGQIELTFVDIEAGATTPSITPLVIYNENTESTVTNSGTTTDPNNLTNVWLGSKSVNVTNVSSLDQIYFDAPLVWDIDSVQSFNGYIKLKTALPNTGIIYVQLYVGSQAVSKEVAIPVNRSSTAYQPFSVAISLFSPIQNYNITRVRIRYVGPAGTISGFYLDYLYFQRGLQPTASFGSVTSVGLAISGDAFTITGSPVTSSGTLTATFNGTSDQYINGLGNKVTFPDIPSIVGAIDGRAKTDEGGVFDEDTLFLQLADSTHDGLLSKELFQRINGNDSIQNVGDGDSLVVSLSDTLIGVKSLKAGTGVTLNVTDTTITINSSGGSRFGVTGEDDAAGETRSFNSAGFPFQIVNDNNDIDFYNSDPGNWLNRFILQGDGNTLWESSYISQSRISLANGIRLWNESRNYWIDSLIDVTEFASSYPKVVVWDSTSNQLFTMYASALPGGGATPTLQQVLDAGSTLSSTETIALGGNNLNYTGTGTVNFQPLIQHRLSYISDFLVGIGNINNGIDAKGAIDFREWSDGTGNIVTLTPVDDITTDYVLFLPPGNNGDTIATRDYARSVGGGGLANLIVDSLGSSGIAVLSPRNDTLYGRRIVAGTNVTVDTLATGEIEISATGGGGSGTVNTGVSGSLAYYPSGGTTVDDFTMGTANQVLGMNNGATGHEYKSLAVGTSGTDFNIAHSANTITLNIPDATSANRGLVTTGSQTIAGNKNFQGTTLLTGGFNSNTTIATSNFWSASATAGSSNSSVYQLKGSTQVGVRSGQAGSTNYTIGSGFSYASFLQGTMNVTEASTGTHPLISGLALKPVTITGAGATTTDATTLYIEGAPTGITPTNPVTSLWVDAGKSLFDDGINIGTQSNGTMGTATLVGGTVTVNTTAVTASSKIFLTVGVTGGTQGNLSVGTVTAATSFVINSTSGTETSQVNWWIIN